MLQGDKASPTSNQYFINNGGGAFTSGFIVGFVEPNAQEIIPVDLDQDGDIDPVVCSIIDNSISWYRNPGGGTFNPQEIIATGATNVRQVAFGDFDGDTDIDIVAALFGSNQLV